jgi:hypothetical protein
MPKSMNWAIAAAASSADQSSILDLRCKKGRWQRLYHEQAPTPSNLPSLSLSCTEPHQL